MEFEDLFVRSSLAGQPIAVLLRPNDEFVPTDDVLIAWQELLSRTLPDRSHSVTRLLATWPSNVLPARIGSVRLRTSLHSRPESGEAFTEVLRERTEPIVVWAEGESLPTDDQWNELLSRLEQADIVSLRRAFSWQAIFTWPIEKLMRGILGIAFGDPLSPIKVMRREAVAPITLQMEGAGVHLELAAKGTYLIRLIDEVPTPDRRASWLAALGSEGISRFLVRPILSLVELPPQGKPCPVKKWWMPIHSGHRGRADHTKWSFWGRRASWTFPGR